MDCPHRLLTAIPEVVQCVSDRRMEVRPAITPIRRGGSELTGTPLEFGHSVRWSRSDSTRILVNFAISLDWIVE